MQSSVCDGTRARSEDPAEVGMVVVEGEGEMKGGEFGHSRERVSERVVKRSKDVNGGADRDGEGAHDAGDAPVL